MSRYVVQYNSEIRGWTDITHPKSFQEANRICNKERSRENKNFPSTVRILPEKESKDVFLNNIKEGDIVIDCGANIGEYSLIAAQKIGSTGKVISIEPSKRIADRLKNNFSLNHFEKFEILQLAIGDKSSKSILYEHGVSELSSLDPTVLDKPITGTSEVQIETLDNIISSRNIDKIDMMKMDIDSFEYDAFLGCKKSFAKNIIKKIICEVHYSLLKKRGIDEDQVYNL